MKITCQSCGAKYTIADDKVRGRTVKIRCKKCSAAIVISAAEEQPENEDGETRIYETSPGENAPGAGALGSPAPQEDAGAEWSLNVAEGDQRTVSAQEIVQLYRSGVVNDDTYAWKDGMADWAPLSEVPELMDKIRGAAPKMSGAPPRPAAGGTPLPAGPEAAMSAAAPKAAARRAEARGKGQDLFGGGGEAAAGGAAAPAGKNSPSQVPLPKPTGLFTAERNENSVLFSLDALRAPKPATQAMPATRTGAPPGGGMGMGMGMGAPPPSGIVDIKKLASIAPPPMDDGRGFDDIANLGGGAMMTALAAPDLTAAPPPEPPPQVAPAMDAYGQPVKQSGGSKMVIVLLAATLAVVVIGFGGFLLFGRSKPAETNPAASATATASAAPTSTDTAKPGETAAATASAGGAAPTDTPAGGTADSKDKDKAKFPGPLDTSKVVPGGPLPTGKAADPKTPEPKATEKTPEPPPPAAATDKPFDRGAAVAALGAAAGAASGCKKADGPTGTGRVAVTFAPTGRVTSANVQGPPFAGTSVGGCVASRFRSASVPPFSGGPVTVNKSFTIN